MNIPYPVRSFLTVLLALGLIGGLTVGCKKSGGSGGSDVDPRDQYVGSYDGAFRITITIVADPQPPEAGTSTINVTKGSNPKEIYIETIYNKSYTEKVTAELNGSNFTVIDKKTDQITVNLNKIDADYNATGAFEASTKKIAYSAVARALRNGTQYTKTYEVTGTMK